MKLFLIFVVERIEKQIFYLIYNEMKTVMTNIRWSWRSSSSSSRNSEPGRILS